jgi:hypothetical protein
MPEMGDLLWEVSVTDPFFEVLHDGDWNACIGKQGDEINYVEGYLQAAQLCSICRGRPAAMGRKC